MSYDLFETETTQIPPGFKPTNWSRGFSRSVGPFHGRTVMTGTGVFKLLGQRREPR